MYNLTVHLVWKILFGIVNSNDSKFEVFEIDINDSKNN